MTASAPVVVIGQPAGQTTDYSQAGALTIARVAGSGSRTKAALMDSLAKALAFPNYFGRNWDALSDTLSTLGDWVAPRRGHVIVVTDADQVLCEEPQEMEVFFGVVEDASIALAAADDWGSEYRGILLVLECAPERAGPLRAALKATGVRFVVVEESVLAVAAWLAR